MGTLVAVFLAAWLLIPAAQVAQPLRLNESLGPGSSEEAALNVFKKHVEDGSGSDLKIALYFQDQLGNPPTPAEYLMTGPLDLYSGAPEYYEPLAREKLGVTSLAYFLPDFATLQRYIASPVPAAARQRILDRGIRFLQLSAERGPHRVIAYCMGRCDLPPAE